MRNHLYYAIALMAGIWIGGAVDGNAVGRRPPSPSCDAATTKPYPGRTGTLHNGTCGAMSGGACTCGATSCMPNMTRGI